MLEPFEYEWGYTLPNTGHGPKWIVTQGPYDDGVVWGECETELEARAVAVTLNRLRYKYPDKSEDEQLCSCGHRPVQHNERDNPPGDSWYTYCKECPCRRYDGTA